MDATERLLVLAPHPDDAILGCGGTLMLAKKGGASILIVIVSDGAIGLPPDRTAEIRRTECLRGLACLGIHGNEVIFWGYLDGAIPLSGAIAARYLTTVLDFRPTRIFVPAPSERQSDHQVVTRGMVNSLADHWTGILWFYETIQPQPNPNAWLDIREVLPNKLSGLSCHGSQTGQFDYLTHVESLSTLRGLQSGVRSAEAFLAYDWDGNWQHFFDPQPLVSIVVRSSRQTFLHEALGSLLRQEYPLFEVIVVWFGDSSPDLQEFVQLDIRCIDGVTRRSENLNRGILEARGEYLGFLDEDDTLLPKHLSILLPQLISDSSLDVCYAGAQHVACELRDGCVVVGAILGTMTNEYRRGQLLLSNQMPINSVIMRRGICNAERFDNTLEAYEDWEFWARLEQRGYHFSSLSEISCEYRHFDLNLALENPILELHQRKGYPAGAEKVLAKILQRCTAQSLRDLEHLMTRAKTEIDHAQAFSEDLQQSLKSAHEHILDLQMQLANANQHYQRCDSAIRVIAGEQATERVVSRLIGEALPIVLVSLVCPVYDTPPELFSQTVNSVIQQSYAHWELILVDDGSKNSRTREVLAQLKRDHAADKRIKFSTNHLNGGISAATRRGISVASGKYVGFLDHDDLLHPDALLEVVLAILGANRPALLYTDSRMIDHAGALLNIDHKTCWAPESLLSSNYINHFTIVRRDLLERLDGFASETDGSQDWDMLLRLSDLISCDEVIHVAKPLYDWRATETSVAYHGSAKPWAWNAACQVLKEALLRKLPHRSVKVAVSASGFSSSWDSELPPIQVIITPHGNAERLKACLDSLLTLTDYPSFDILIVTSPDESSTTKVAISEHAESPNVSVIEGSASISWNGCVNAAVRARGEGLLLFLHDDVEILERNWLRRMASYFALQGVGAVGARLNYPDGRVQHNGIATHPDWIARSLNDSEPALLSAQVRNVSAVSSACLLTSRDAFDKVGGLDEILTMRFWDVDYCLALRSYDFRIVQANDVRLCHHDLKSSTASNPAIREQEKSSMRNKWKSDLIEHYLPCRETYFETTRMLKVV